jgi:uncharacterized protein (TIGR02186 family)
MTRRFLYSFLLYALASGAWAQPNNASVPLSNPMVADVSQHAIEIRSDFNGTQLLVFGARNVPGDIVVAVRGPRKDITLRRKDRIAGMWMHVDAREYDSIPVFYALASTNPLNRIAPPALLQSLGLGERRLIAASTRAADEKFDAALANILSKQGWWQLPFGEISYFGESLFKARVELPDSLPSGHYTAEIYLFARGKLVGLQTIPLESYKVGIDARIANAARDQGLLYGIIAVLMALAGGWIGHRLFHR